MGLDGSSRNSSCKKNCLKQDSQKMTLHDVIETEKYFDEEERTKEEQKLALLTFERQKILARTKNVRFRFLKIYFFEKFTNLLVPGKSQKRKCGGRQSLH